MSFDAWLDLALARAYEAGLVPEEIARMTPQELVDVIGGRGRQHLKDLKDLAFVIQSAFGNAVGA